MYLYGAGGHAKVIIDILTNSNIPVNGIFDDSTTVTVLNSCRVIGKYDNQVLDAPLIISIGNNAVRAKIAQQFHTEFGIAVHRSAIVSPSASIKQGTVVMQGTIIQASATIGEHVIVNTSASIDHDCIVKDFAHISPGAVLCGHVTIGEGTLVGAGTVVTPGIIIGKWCKINAGSVISSNIPDFATVSNAKSFEIKRRKNVI
ncbi:acetyltransferase [Pontibacter sp. KCTC 32443]|uniref:acetyltransferase n=1 Tax=Pontibacter TaxID=323449 RepID=UPI00164ED637|nr:MULTISPECIES: acetyltransferase [Pontibacter]MBC5773016.1 acetyltransferase [Pontibacter sp. KCTC 32443]